MPSKSAVKPTSMQVATQAIKPVRPFNRFGASKIANTGSDPQGSFKHFV